MSRIGARRHTAFNGQVTFETEPYLTPMVLITIERIQNAISTDGFGEMEKLFFTDFTENISRTIAIHFDLNEQSPPMCRALQRFWDQASIFPRDWNELWDLFLRTYDTGDVREEWDKALRGNVPADMAAAPELATPLPEDDEELENIPEDSPLSENGIASTERVSSSSSRRKERNAVKTG